MGDLIPVMDAPVAAPATKVAHETPSVVDPEALIAQLKLISADPSVLKGADERQLRDIKKFARSAANAVEQPFETMVRIAYSPMPIVTARVGQDHGIFAHLCAASVPVSLQDLSASSGIEIGALESIMDCLCAQEMADQVETDTFIATRLTHFLSEPLLRSTYIHYHDALLPGFIMFNKSLHDPTGRRTAWQIGQNTDQDYYEWLEEHPIEKEAFHHYMKSHLIGLPIWLDVLDFQQEFGAGASKDDVLFVDVGGSIGQQCEALKKRYPDLPGRVIVQDRPEVLGKALEVEGMEKMGYDYLTEQPIKGARVLYFRQIFHNNHDEDCRKIIAAQLPAMDENTILVVDDKVLPNKKPSTDEPGVEYQAALSLVMRTIFNSMERRETHWRKLLTGAGLVIKEIRKYTKFDDSVIICTKAPEQ